MLVELMSHRSFQMLLTLNLMVFMFTIKDYHLYKLKTSVLFLIITECLSIVKLSQGFILSNSLKIL